MKRKLIDISDSTFERLSAKAGASGSSLKRYIENLLDEDAKNLSEPRIGYGYRFVSGREPSDAELMAILDAASSSVLLQNREAQDMFFDRLDEEIKESSHGR